jgi:hypothetical protein
VTGETRIVELSEEELARIDALAALRKLTREAMLEELTRVGLARWEEEGPPPAPDDRSSGNAGSSWLGWALLGFVVLAVGLGGWALVRSLE